MELKKILKHIRPIISNNIQYNNANLVLITNSISISIRLFIFTNLFKYAIFSSKLYRSISALKEDII